MAVARAGARLLVGRLPRDRHVVFQVRRPGGVRQLHVTVTLGCIKGPANDEDTRQSAVITRGYFDREQDDRNKESFEGAVDIFTHKDTRRRGSVEFIYAAMRNMEQFGVHRDLGSYKKLMEVFPKGKMIPENRLQADFFHYPKQQQCATVLLQKMEMNKVQLGKK
jgi:signaling intermediate in Toll pathway protein